MDIEPIYKALVAGTGDVPDPERLGPLLFRRALEDTRNPDPDRRLEALRVAAALGPDLALPVIRALVDDRDTRVRTWAFNQAVAAREKGIAVLRDAAHGTDPTLVAASLELLELRMDRPSAGVGRRGLDNPDPRVRVAAARLLGRIAGPAVTVQLRNAVELDPDPRVKLAAREALDRIGGKLERGVPRTWWDEDLAAPALPAPSPGATDTPAPAWQVRAAPSEAPAAPPPEPEPEPEARALPVPAPPAVPAAPEPEPEPQPETPWDGRHAALPTTLPTQTRALLRLLGMVAPSDRAAVLAALGAASDLGDLLGSWPAGGDLALGRGLALAIAGLRRTVGLSRVRQMAADPQPGVRAAAAEAIGALGAASTLPSLASLVADRDPDVRAVAVGSLAAMAVRIDRRDWARDQIRGLGEQPEAVAAAVTAALAELDA